MANISQRINDMYLQLPLTRIFGVWLILIMDRLSFQNKIKMENNIL